MEVKNVLYQGQQSLSVFSCCHNSKMKCSVQNSQPCSSMQKLRLHWTNYWAWLQLCTNTWCLLFLVSIHRVVQVDRIRTYMFGSVLCKTSWATGLAQKKILVSSIISVVTVFEGRRALLFLIRSLVMVSIYINEDYKPWGEPPLLPSLMVQGRWASRSQRFLQRRVFGCKILTSLSLNVTS